MQGTCIIGPTCQAWGNKGLSYAKVLLIIDDYHNTYEFYGMHIQLDIPTIHRR